MIQVPAEAVYALLLPFLTMIFAAGGAWWKLRHLDSAVRTYMAAEQDFHLEQRDRDAEHAKQHQQEEGWKRHIEHELGQIRGQR